MSQSRSYGGRILGPHVWSLKFGSIHCCYIQLILIRSCTPIQYVSRGTPMSINTKIVASINQSSY